MGAGHSLDQGETHAVAWAARLPRFGPTEEGGRHLVTLFWGQALAAYVALADSSPEGIRDFTAGAAWAPALGALAPKTVLAAGELLMLPNGKPDRLAMTVRLTELHQGK